MGVLVAVAWVPFGLLWWRDRGFTRRYLAASSSVPYPTVGGDRSAVLLLGRHGQLGGPPYDWARWSDPLSDPVTDVLRFARRAAEAPWRSL